MSSSAAVDREYAYFRAVGHFAPADITGCVGVEPSESWSEGEEFTRRGHTLKRRGSSWILRSGLNDTEPLTKHVDALLRELAPRRSGLLEASSMAKLQIVCVGYYGQSFSWELETEHVRLAGALNIGFWFDAYSYGDLHEEITELREQLGVRTTVL